MERAQAAPVRYAVAMLAVAAAFLVRLACDNWLHERSALDFFLAATAVSAWFGGVGPATLSIVLSTLVGSWFFVEPRGSPLMSEPKDFVETASFIFAASAIVWLSGSMKKATAAARSSARDALREVEERRRIERELQVLNERLEERVDVRTTELQHALKELEAYAYSIAHNLRAPLRGMAGLSDLLRDEEGERLSYEGKEQLARIIDASRRMDELILGLLDYSRVSRGEFPQERIHLADSVREALELRHEDLESHHAEVDVDPNLPDIMGHRQSMVHVISHLLSNAAKFVAPGVRPRIRIRAEQKGSRVRLWVEDNGIGIDPRYHDRVFVMFERLHQQEEYPGTGIGLAIVRKCMERMGGGAAVESEIGKGSRFWVEAPAAPPPTP